MTVATLFPPLQPRSLTKSRYKNKLRVTHCYKLRNIRERKGSKRRLGSGFLPPICLDSLILGHLLPRIHTFLQDQKAIASKAVIEADLPDRDDSSQLSGSFKGAKVGQRPHGNIKERAPDRDVLVGVPYKDASGFPVLPPIGQGPNMALTPIGEASREHTQGMLSVQQYGRDADEEVEEKWMGEGMTEGDVVSKAQRQAEEKKRREERRRAKIPHQNLDLEGPVATGGAYLMSSSESLNQSLSSGRQPHPPHRQQWKGSTQSLRSYGSRKGPGSTTEEGSMKGSVIFGPDGEVIKVGGQIQPHTRPGDHVTEVDQANLPHPRDMDSEVETDTEMPDEWRVQRQRPLSARKSDSIHRQAHRRGTPGSQVTEQDIIDSLTEHASRIASSVLSQEFAGTNIEADIRTVIDQVMNAKKRNSAGPTVAEYRNQIRENLVTAIANMAGVGVNEIPLDAEIDPELMQALADSTLTPEDIEIVKDEVTGRSFIRSRRGRIAENMGGVKEGHIYKPGTKDAAGKMVSIPVDRTSNMDIGEMGVVHYTIPTAPDETGSDKVSQVSVSQKSVSEKLPSEKLPSERESKAGSVRTRSPAKSLAAGSATEEGGTDRKSQVSVKSSVSFKGVEEDEFKKAVDQLEAGGSPKAEEADLVSLKSGASSLKSEDKKSKASSKKPSTPTKKEEFVVGKVKHTKELEDLYGQPPGEAVKPEGKPKEKKPKVPAAPKKDGKKGKKGGKKGKAKKEEVALPEPPAEETALLPKEPSPEPPKEEPPAPPKAPTPESVREESPEFVKSESEEDFVIVRDETPSPEPVADTQIQIPTSPEEEPDDEQEEDTEDMSEADKLRMISNREARAAKRAAAAEKRRQEVERKRKEREEQMKKEKEELERQERLKQELEEQRLRKEEERRLKRLQEQEDLDAMMSEELERERKRQQELEREKRLKEEYARKLEEMKKRQAEEDQRRQEEAQRRAEEEEQRRREEEALMATMAEQERLEYERKKKEEEEERLRKEEEEKRRREEEAQRALEEARRLAEEMARKQAEMEARLRFNRTLQLESNGLEHTQDINKAFIFSYFDLLQWLGLDIPEFELLKLNQY